MESEETNVVVEQNLLSKFECPVCFKYIVPPIRLCLSGHGYCTVCFDKLNNCALCRANKSPYRCIILEQIHATLTFPCKYFDQGCDFKGKGDVMTSHQEYCEFSSVLCPLRFNNCNWQGLQSQVMNHCNTAHKQNVFVRSTQKLKVTNFPQFKGRQYFILFFVYDTLFRCSWDLNEQNGTMRFAVYFLGKPSPYKKFSFKISILTKSSQDEAITLTGPCFHLKDDTNRFIEKKYLSTNLDMVREFVDTNGDFNYMVTVVDENSKIKSEVNNIINLLHQNNWTDKNV